MRLYLLLISILPIFVACSSTLQVERLYFNPNSIEAKHFEAVKLEFHQTYFSCVYGTFVANLHSDEFDMSDVEVYEFCADHQPNYYKAIYYSSFGGFENKKVRPGDRHKTAISAVNSSRRNAKRLAREL